MLALDRQDLPQLRLRAGPGRQTAHVRPPTLMDPDQRATPHLHLPGGRAHRNLPDCPQLSHRRRRREQSVLQPRSHHAVDESPGRRTPRHTRPLVVRVTDQALAPSGSILVDVPPRRRLSPRVALQAMCCVKPVPEPLATAFTGCLPVPLRPGSSSSSLAHPSTILTHSEPYPSRRDFSLVSPRPQRRQHEASSKNRLPATSGPSARIFSMMV